MRKRIELRENELQEKVNNAENKLEQKIKHRIEEIYDSNIHLDYLKQNLIYLEDRTRRVSQTCTQFSL